MFWAIGVVTRTPKIDRELQQNHSKTHNAIEHKKQRKSVGPLSKSGGRLLWTTLAPCAWKRLTTTHNDFTTGSQTDDPLNAAQGVVMISKRRMPLEAGGARRLSAIR